MLPASNRGAGLNVGGPDVCLTPPAPGVPVPYTNYGPHCLAVPFSPVVFVCGLPALNLASKIPITFGDDPGVLHPVFKQVGTFVAGCPNVFVDLLPAVNLTSPTTGNAMNDAIGAHAVPNAVNVFYNHALRGGSSGDEARAIAAEIEATPKIAAAGIEDGIGHLRIGVFSEDLPARVFDAIRRLGEAGLRALIVDLRGCPGGEVDAALRLAADFLPRGAEIATLEDEDGDERTHRAHRDGPHTLPVVLLVDGATASAAELFAGSLQANGRALVVGGRTHGKARAQAARWAQDGAGLVYATVGRCLLPGGASVEGVGLSPDVAVPGGEDPLPRARASAQDLIAERAELPERLR